MLILYSLTLFLGAFLLFLIQPMVGRMVLPRLGGAPAVWNGCMVFFQFVLLAGYAYAHALPARLGVRRHAGVHLALIALALLALPPRLAGWAPPTGENPVPWLIALLAAMVGAPALALATGAPLLQRWFAASSHRQSRDPYFLYAASNAGSLAALIGYPLAIEPRLTLAAQAALWSGGALAWVGLTAACAVVLWRSGARAPLATDDATTGPMAARESAGRAPARDPAAERGRRDSGAPAATRSPLRWVLLALVPSSLMLGVTTYITTDVAAIPLLWVLPLALYLVTYIIAFARPPAVVHRAALALLPVATLALIAMPMVGAWLGIGTRVAVHLGAFFIAAMVCHGELAATRPSSERLTAFYLWLSVGGVLGGALNALVAPVLFSRVFEYPLLIAAVALLRPGLPIAAAPAKARPRRPREDARTGGKGWLAFGGFAAVLLLAQTIGAGTGTTLYTHRNFFGLIRVKVDREHALIGLQHGTTMHGVESLDPGRRDEPLGYFSRPGPLGDVFAARDSAHPVEPIGVVGLGAGTIACYARPEQAITFYEIDPAVVRVARDTTWFHYVTDAEARGARLSVTLGDARLELAKSAERYGVLVLDAFSSDAIPIHLLTREALDAYLGHLAPGGVLAFHVSSQYLRLEPALAALANDAHLVSRYRLDAVPDPADRLAGRAPSRWVVMAREERDLGALASDARWSGLGDALPRAWSDDYASITPLVLWGRAGPGR